MSFLKLKVYEPGIDGHLQWIMQGIPVWGRKSLPYVASDAV